MDFTDFSNKIFNCIDEKCEETIQKHINKWYGKIFLRVILGILIILLVFATYVAYAFYKIYEAFAFFFLKDWD